ncbi:hypothetical protein GF345_01970 [Candidatus Woesearchaeota archaeon]|nr:hypothetical protein [Candidatus Woesearchaeota archaeon]
MVRVGLSKLEEKNYVKLSEESIIYIKDIVRKTGLLLDKKTKENIYRMSLGKKISIRFLRKLKRGLDIPETYINKNITLISSVKNTDIGINNPRLPFNFNSADGARILAAIMGDGELNNQIHVRYNNQNYYLISKVKQSVKNLFGEVDIKVYPRTDKTYQLHLPKIVGLCIVSLGLKPGAKIYTDNNIPSFMFKAKKEFKAVFIRQFFNDEGNVRQKDRRLQIKQSIVNKTKSRKAMKSYPEEYCPRVLKDIKIILQDFDIVSKITLGHIRGNKSDWELSIYGKDNLERFYENIGFNLDYKNRMLDRCIKSYKFPSAPRNRRIEFAVHNCMKIEEEYGFITRYLLANQCKRSLKTATYYMVDLRKKKMLKRISVGKYRLAI